MRRTLQLHPDGRSTAVTRLDVTVARPEPSRLEINYDLAGKIEDLKLPEPMNARRGDAL